MTRSKIILAALASAATGAAVIVGRRLLTRNARSNEPAVTDPAQEHAQSKRDRRVAARHARQQKRHAREQHVN